jgi:CrcB protein
MTRAVPGPDEPPMATDPDVDLRVPAQRRELAAHPAAVLGAIAVGGALGALGRFGVATALPTATGAFPWSTFAINVSGCFLIGVLMVAITEVWTAHPLVRPFLGVGVLGGYTTFSTSVVDFQRLVTAGAAATGLAYLAGTLVAALAALWLATVLTRAATASRRRAAPAGRAGR